MGEVFLHVMGRHPGKRLSMGNVIAFNNPAPLEQRKTQPLRHPGIALDAAGGA